MHLVDSVYASAMWRTTACLVLIALIGASLTSCSKKAEGASTQRVHLTAVSGETGDRWYSLDSTRGAVLEQALYNGEPVGTDLSVALTSSRPSGQFSGHLPLTATLTYPDGQTIVCDAPASPKRGDLIFAGGVVELACPSYRGDQAAVHVAPR